MIQRIQTLYLLIAAILMTVMLFTPLARFFGQAEEFRLMAFGVKNISQSAGIGPGSPFLVSTAYMGVLIALCALIPLVGIFLFKKRWIQIRLCFAEIVLLVGAQLFVAYYIYRSYKSVAGFEYHSIGFTVPDVFPLISLVLVIMALRGIIRDETLVKSLDRIR